MEWSPEELQVKNVSKYDLVFVVGELLPEGVQIPDVEGAVVPTSDNAQIVVRKLTDEHSAASPQSLSIKMRASFTIASGLANPSQSRQPKGGADQNKNINHSSATPEVEHNDKPTATKTSINDNFAKPWATLRKMISSKDESDEDVPPRAVEAYKTLYRGMKQPR
ncbi:Fc.00g041910.m01.CDS01 [Cosmosporella sp. VM-42]